MDVVVHQAEHLRLLERAHAAFGAGHEDAHAFFAAHGVLSGAAGVATGGAQDIKLLTASGQLVLEQMAQQLHRHVLKSQRGAIGQRLQVQGCGLAGHIGLLEPPQGHDRPGTKYLFGVGALAQGAQVSRRNVVDVEREQLEGQGRIAPGLVRATPAAQHGGVYLRVMLGQVQAAVGRQALQQNVTKAFALRVAAGGEVTHFRPALPFVSG